MLVDVDSTNIPSCFTTDHKLEVNTVWQVVDSDGAS